MYVTGSTSSYGSGQGFTTSDIFLLKYGPSGEAHWSRTWGGLQNDYGTGVTVDSAGNVYVAGSTNSYGGQSDFVLLKYDPSGNLLFQKVWGGAQNDFGTGVAVDAGGNAWIQGHCQTAPRTRSEGINYDSKRKQRFGYQSIQT